MAAKDRQVGGDHYQRRLQPWDIIDEYGLDYYEGNAIKYILRWKGDRVEDLQKAIHYLEKEIEMYSEIEEQTPGDIFMADEIRDDWVSAKAEWDEAVGRGSGARRQCSRDGQYGFPGTTGSLRRR